jgi:hypothetical protein
VNELPVRAEATQKQEAPIIHPLSAVLMVAIDNLWLLADWAALLWMVTIPLSFVAVMIPTYLIQKHVRGDSTGRALAVSSLLGVLAAIPTPITGTTAGFIVLGYAGFRWLRRGRH